MNIRFFRTPFNFILPVISLAVASCFQAPSLQPATPLTADNNNIIQMELNSATSLPRLIKELAKADYVLLGEAHDDPMHHKLQHQILDLLIKAGRKPAVVFEMFNREDEGLIISTTRRFPLDSDRIAAAVDWEDSGWPDWNMYRPIVQTALDAGLPVVAGNLSRLKARQLIMDQASFMPNIKTLTQLGMREPLPKLQHKLLQNKITTAHGERIPHSIIKGMVIAQRLRDATMAEAMISRNLGNGAVLIAGQEHVRADYGVPHYLRFREPEARIISLAFELNGKFEEELQSDDRSRHPFDYIWFLPQSNNQHIAHQ